MKTMLKDLSGIRKTHSILTQKGDTSRPEQEELKVSYEEFIRECSVLTDNLNVITEEHDAIQRDTDNLVDPEGRAKMMFEEPFKHSRGSLDSNPKKRYFKIRA
jgi:hypothetical protein